MWRLWALVAAGGCNAQLGLPADRLSDGGGAASTDSATHDAAIDAPSLCPSGRVVYLDFGGETLLQATASDATTNHAVWMGVTAATLPKFRPNAGDRDQQITDITSQVRAKLTAVPQVTIVNTRPTTGPYVLIGFGGDRTMVNVPYTGAVNRNDCGDVVKSDLGWVFESAASTTEAANYAAGAIAFGLGVTGTTDPDDCMCSWLTACSPSGNACTYSSSITADLRCPNQVNPQNEVAILQAFCQ